MKGDQPTTNERVIAAQERSRLPEHFFAVMIDVPIFEYVRYLTPLESRTYCPAPESVAQRAEAKFPYSDRDRGLDTATSV